MTVTAARLPEAIRRVTTPTSSMSASECRWAKRPVAATGSPSQEASVSTWWMPSCMSGPPGLRSRLDRHFSGVRTPGSENVASARTTRPSAPDAISSPTRRAAPPEPLAHHQPHARIRAGPRDPLGVLDGVGDGLLDEHAEPALGARERDVRVRVVRRQDQRRLDAGVLGRDAKRRRRAAPDVLGERAPAVGVAAEAR